VLGFDSEISNWSLQDGGFMQKMKSSQILRIWLSFTNSIQGLRLIHHQMEWLLSPFLRSKKPLRVADVPQVHCMERCVIEHGDNLPSAH
jgi:hypothetical protein